MTVLLDTHAFLWFVLDDPHLSKTAKQTIADSSNQVFISPANYLEIAIKISAGKYQLNGPFDRFWTKGMTENRISVLHIDLRHSCKLLDLPFHHKDPFDRMLIAQSLEEDIPLVGRDLRFDAYGVNRIW